MYPVFLQRVVCVEMIATHQQEAIKLVIGGIEVVLAANTEQTQQKPLFAVTIYDSVLRC